MKSRFMLCGVLLSICGGLHAQAPLKIALAKDSEPEKATKAQIERLVAKYDLSPWIFTTSVVIDDSSLPHSHPVLTLHTRHLKDDDLLLSTFVHEQLHWYITQNQKKAEAAVEELKVLYPDIPIGFPQGSRDAEGNYYHLLVIYLEYRANRDLLGELRARQVMEFWAADHYTWIYKTILEQERKIGAVLRKHELIPNIAR